MKLKYIQILFALCLCVFMVQSCANDSKSKVTTDVETEIEEKGSEVIQETEVAEDSVTDDEDKDDETEIEDDEADVETGTTEDTEDSMPPEQIEKADEIIASVSEDDVFAVDANRLYRMHCAICHGFKGNAKVNGAKDLTRSKVALNESVAQIYHGKGLMTPYKGILRDVEIVALAKYAETLRK